MPPGIVDPDHADHCSPELTAFCGLDVLCHSLESFTAIPYQQRSAAPKTPMLRPAYQVLSVFASPIADQVEHIYVLL
jgi:alcohol dehydrogenase class IV